MKKGRWILPVCIVVIILALCVVIAFWLFQVRGLNVTVGRCLAADREVYMLIDGDCPIVMYNRTKYDVFMGLSTGDEILVVHDGIDDSYPGGTGAYFVLRLHKGTVSDISGDVITQLQELGWLQNNGWDVASG